jgi:hypothetical protein
MKLPGRALAFDRSSELLLCDGHLLVEVRFYY